jgi:hypothetical protein
MMQDRSVPHNAPHHALLLTLMCCFFIVWFAAVIHCLRVLCYALKFVLFINRLFRRLIND